MSEWLPILSNDGDPRYTAFVKALERAIECGEVRPGTRLLPQRDMAQRLGISVGTVSKAYREAERRGLLSGQVGRGTYVAARTVAAGARNSTAHGANPGATNLSLNIAPDAGDSDLLATTFAEILAQGATGDLLGYLPHQGMASHREAIATWLARNDMHAEAERVLITHGAQHALAIAVAVLGQPRATIAAERLSYSGLISLARMNGNPLVGIALDEHGMVPESLDAELSRSSTRLVYAMPTLQTPTAAMMPLARRKEIAALIRRHDAFLIEDDVYSFLCEHKPTPIAMLIPERSIYLTSFAKALAPGLRVGAMVVPLAMRDAAVNAVRATGWMATPLMAEAVARLIGNGGLDDQVMKKRAMARARVEMVREVMPEILSPAALEHPAFHVWLRLPERVRAADLMTRTAMRGIVLAPPFEIAPAATAPGIRLCLGSVAGDAELRHALGVVRNAMAQDMEMSVV